MGQVQHNQAAVKQKLLERLADDVCIDTKIHNSCNVCVLCLEWQCVVDITDAFSIEFTTSKMSWLLPGQLVLLIAKDTG